MSSKKNISNFRLTWHVVAYALACAFVLTVLVPVPAIAADAGNFGTALIGLRVTDSSKNQSAGEGGQPGKMPIGLRVTNSNSTKPITVRVTFSGNGGMWGAATTQGFDVTLLQPTVAPAEDPKKPGYKFDGWSTTPTGEAEELPTKTTQSATWYAVWKADTYPVKFDPNTGSGGPTASTATYNSSMEVITSFPTKKGYEFLGYFDAQAGGEQYYKADGTSARNWDKTSGDTLYAQWKAKTYTVKFDFAEGKDGDATATVTYDAPMPEIKIPDRGGYTFAGYFDDQNTQYYDADGKSKVNWNKDANNVTLKAHWTLQIAFAFPTAALIKVDASGNVTGDDLEFSSQSADAIKVTAVKSTQSESAASLFADDTTLKGVRILLKPTTGAADSEIEVPLTTTATGISITGGWTIAANTNLAIAFGLSLPEGAQLNYLTDAQVAVANLSYEVEAAPSS